MEFMLKYEEIESSLNHLFKLEITVFSCPISQDLPETVRQTFNSLATI